MPYEKEKYMENKRRRYGKIPKGVQTRIYPPQYFRK
jgi:hypothetical protein